MDTLFSKILFEYCVLASFRNVQSACVPWTYFL